MWFHIRLLEQCNLKCASCYAKAYKRSTIMAFSLFKDILSTISEIDQINSKMSVIYLSGGEPLLHPNFFQFLDSSFSQFDRITILTNGLLVKKFVPKFLTYKEKLCVQISIDGDRVANDKIRGKNVFNKAVEALHILNENNIKHWISYTVSQTNKHCFMDIIDVAKNTNSFFNNVTPYIGETKQMLDYYEWKEFKYNYEKHSKQIGLEMAHAPNCCGFQYNCGAYFGGVTINPDGSLAGCARINDIKGHYPEIKRYLLNKPLSITETCMKNKWNNIQNFNITAAIE